MHASERPRPISRRKRAAFVAIVFFVLFLFLEALSFFSLRWIEGRWYSWSSAADTRSRTAWRTTNQAPVPVSTFAGVVHPYVGYVMPPDWAPAWDEESTHRPCDGFPSRRPVVQKRSENTILVGIFGGSVAEIFYNVGAPAMVQMLREHEKFRDKNFVVLCLACGGYKQPQQLMALNYVLAQGGELDLLINIDGFNEVALHPAENQKHGVFPIYPRAWNARVGQIRDSRILKLYGRAGILEDDLHHAAGFCSTAPMSFSPTCHLIWHVWNRTLEKQLRETKSAIENFDDNSVRTGEGYQPASEQSMYDDLIQIWESSSRQMGALCEANHVRYYHFLQPNQYVEGSKPLDPVELKKAFRDDHPYREGVKVGYPLLRKAGERLSATRERFVDLSDAFATTPEEIYYDDCCHFGKRGNEIIARRIAETIISDPRGE